MPSDSTLNPQPSPLILSGRRILLAVSGSIAAYKAADLASQLGHLGADVHVVLTRAAAEFVGPATFRGITLNPVLTSVFDEPFDRQIAHIEAAQRADLVVVAPATADVIAKMAHGIADDAVTTCLLATTAPILVAPAMNTVMLAHPATQANLRILRERGVEIVEPGFGMLACRTEGPGKLSDVSDIIRAVVDRLTRSGDYAGKRVVVTAGATREPLDPVRFISNRSSGKMGFALAEAAASRGALVTLIAAHTSVPTPPGVAVIRVGTTEEMLEACRAPFAACDLFIAAAAPADYSPLESVDSKRKKDGGEWTIRLRETPDILATLARDKDRQLVIGFAAETEDLLTHAADKLRRKNLDLIIANDVTAEGAGFESDTNVVTLLWPDGRTESTPRLPKRHIADRILDAAVRGLRVEGRGYPVFTRQVR